MSIDVKKSNSIQLVEALLFLENRPVNITYISRLTGLDRNTVKQSINEIKTRLETTSSSLTITSNDSGDVQLTIRKELYQQLGKYYDTRRKLRLSPQALETLAIIAYKQPVTRVEIEKLRGVNVGYILKILMEMQLICIKGKKDAPGKPILYGTTDKFLRYFGLHSIRDLPPLEEFDKF